MRGSMLLIKGFDPQVINQIEGGSNSIAICWALAGFYRGGFPIMEIPITAWKQASARTIAQIKRCSLNSSNATDSLAQFLATRQFAKC